MAEEKKGVLVYADWIEHFEALEDVEAGQLIKHFFRYVNDKNPEYPNRLIQIAFNPIKSVLKRDLEKWQNRKEKSSENGRIGNLKKYHIDLYNRYLCKELTLEYCENIAKSRKPSLPDSNPTKNVANLAVSVSVSDSVSVNDITSTNVEVEKENFDDEVLKNSNSLDEKIKEAFLKNQAEEKRKKISPKKESNQDFANSLKFESPSWLESISIQQKKASREILIKIDEFVSYLKTIEKNHLSRKEFMTHFVNWVTKKFKENEKPNTTEGNVIRRTV